MQQPSQLLLDVRYQPPWLHSISLLLVSGGLFCAMVLLWQDDARGALQYLGILGLLGAICGFLGLLMLFQRLRRPGRFRIYEDRIAFPGLFRIGEEEIRFEDLQAFQSEYLGRHLNMLYLKRKRGGKLTVYPAWFQSDKDWLAVIGELRRRIPLD